MWCNPCRAVGMIHCAHPDECGNMLSDEAAADNWKAWLDDLPLDVGFAEGIGQVQDFISGTVARADAAETALAAERVKVAKLVEALTFYANASDYKSPLTGGMGKLWGDCGQVARAAITESGQ